MLYGPIFSSKTEVISNDIQKKFFKKFCFQKEQNQKPVVMGGECYTVNLEI